MATGTADAVPDGSSEGGVSTAVILPALDEAEAVTEVVAAFAAQVDRVVLCDNGSSDDTVALATAAGAEVVHVPRRGYGSAVLAGIEHLRSDPVEVVVFADCDGTIDAAETALLVAPIAADTADLTLGWRTDIARGALPLRNRVARWMARFTFLVLHGLWIHDLGPFRAVRWTTLEAMALRHPTYGLPVETVGRARRVKGRVVEVRTRYLNRTGGESKVGARPLQAAQVALVMVWTAVRVRFGRRVR